MRIKATRILTWVAKGLGYTLGVLVLLVVIVLIGLQTPWAQHKIATVISEQADKSLKGRVVVTLDGSLTLFGFSQLSVRILPQDQNDNAPLAELSNVRASWDLVSLVKSLFGSGALDVGVHHVEVERAFVDLRSDADGNLALINATTVEPSNEPEPASTGPAPLIHVGAVDIFDTRIVLPPQKEPASPPMARQVASIDRIHADFDMQDAMSGTVTLSSLEAAIPGQESTFLGDASAAYFVSGEGVPSAKATLYGALQGVAVTVDGLYDDKQWLATVSVDGSAEEWQGTGFGFEPTDPVSIVALALGDLESAEVNADVAADGGAVRTWANVAFSPLVASGVLHVHNTNPRSFALAAPTGRINLAAALDAQGEPQNARVSVALRDSLLEENPIPDFDLNARASGMTHAEFQLSATDDSGLKLTGEVDDLPEGLKFSVQGRAKRLPDTEAIPQLSAFDVRDLELDTQGTWKGQTQALDASLRLDLARLAIPSATVAVADLSVRVTAQGKLTAPAVDGTITARALRAGELRASNLRVQADHLGRGESNVEATARVHLAKDAPARDLSARTTIAALSPLTAKATRVQLASKKHTLVLAVGMLESGERTLVNDVRVTGVGQLRGQFLQVGNSVRASANTDALDLVALSELFQPMVPPVTGAVSANVALESTGERLTAAHVFARAAKVGTRDAQVDDLGASLVVKRDELSGTINVQRGKSEVRVNMRDVDLYKLRRASSQPGFGAEDFRGHVMATVLAHSRDFTELEQAQGEIHAEGSLQAELTLEQRDDMPLKFDSAVRLRDVDLRKAEPRVPTDWLSGKDAAIDQDKSGRSNNDVAKRSTAKVVAAKRDKTNKRASEAEPPARHEVTSDGSEWAITGLNAEWKSAYDGSSGRWQNSVAASDRNRPVTLATVSLTTKVPLSRLNDQIGAWLPNAPLDGSLVIPSVSLDSLPSGSFVPTGIDASIKADIRLSGTVSAPQAEGSLALEDLQVSTSNDSFPVSIVVDTKASKQAISANFRLTHDGLLLMSGNVEGSPAQNEWLAVAKIDDLPLGRMPYVRDYGVAGSLSGDLTFDTGKGNPSVVVALQAKDVKAYGEKIPTTNLNAQLTNGEGSLVADIRQATGSLIMTAAATSPTGSLADYRPIKARVEARSFQIRPILVALQGAVSDLAGVLDGAVDVTFTNGATEATGQLKLRDGLVLMPALGKQVHDIEVALRATPGELQIERLDAKVERGLVRGDGTVRYTPDGRMTADLELRLPDDRRLPIANKGRNVAEASGRIKLAASVAPQKETKLSVDIPVLDVYFSDSATDKVMSSESPAFVSLGTYLPDGHFVTYTSARDGLTKKAATSAETATTTSKPTLVTIKLGKKVWLHHGTSTFAGINGEIEASLGQETILSGMLNLAEGRIDIQGRVFDIRPGTVTFRGESPPNPDVVAEAAWNAPSGHTIIAAYRGSVANGKVILRSEPPLSYGEILNVLLFDDPEGAGGSDGSPGAGEVAATIASAGLSKSLTSLTDLDIQANIETDAAGSPRPELGVRLTPRLAVEVAYNLEPSAALSQPPDKAFVSFDWRLSNAWTVEATLGDHGSAATDLTWKYRY